jgi:Flp pilus assembly protein TadG
MVKIMSDLREPAKVLLHGFCRAAALGRTRAEARSIGDRLCAYLRSGGEGQSLVEFALVLPMLLMTLTFMFSLGLGMLSYEQLAGATSYAALSQLATARGVTGDPCNAIELSVSGALPSWKAANLTYTVTIQNSSGTNVTYGPTTGTGFSCTAAYSALYPTTTNNTPGSLTVSYPYTWIPVFMQHMTGNLTATQPVTVY